jgi:hypothetical protein
MLNIWRWKKEKQAEQIDVRWVHLWIEESEIIYGCLKENIWWWNSKKQPSSYWIVETRFIRCLYVENQGKYTILFKRLNELFDITEFEFMQNGASIFAEQIGCSLHVGMFMTTLDLLCDDN